MRMRWRGFVCLGLLSLGLFIGSARPIKAVGPAAAAVVLPLLHRAAQLLACFVIDYGMGKAVDYYFLEDIQEQLGDWLPFLKADAERASGGDRGELLAMVGEAKRVMALYGSFALQSFSRTDAEALEKEVRQLAGKYGDLEHRLGGLERRLDSQGRRLDQVERRLERVESILQAECKDMAGRQAAAIGDHLVLLGDEDLVFRASDEFEGLKTRATIYLNACTGDLGSRGILIVLQTTTRDLVERFEVALTFKDLDQKRMAPPNFNHIFRQRIPLFRPGSGVEGRISEIFLPHDSLPTSDGYHRLGLALVLLHGGQPLFSAEKGLECYGEKPLHCAYL